MCDGLLRLFRIVKQNIERERDHLYWYCKLRSAGGNAVKKAQQVIFLVDMNAFFIGWEALWDPSLRDLRAAVAGDPKKRSGIV